MTHGSGRPAPMTPQPARRHWFLRAVSAGIVAYVLIAGLALPGPGRGFAIGAVACGLTTGVAVAMIHLLRRGRVLDIVAGTAVVGVFARGLESIRRP
jgi:uncharacterized RDD family membrane protein YckC